MDAHILLSPVGQKTETRFNCLLTENRKSTEMVGTPSTVRVYSFHRCGGPPPSRREVWGVRRSRPSALPSIAYRGFAVAPITLRAPPIFCKLSIFSPQRPPSSREGDRPQAVEGVFRRRKAYSFPKLKYIRQNAEPCAGFRRILLNFIFNSARSVNVPAFFGREHPPRTKEI